MAIAQPLLTTAFRELPKLLAAVRHSEADRTQEECRLKQPML